MFVPRKHRPHPHLGPGLVQWQPVIANNQHVRIIPVAGTRELTKPILVLAVIIDDPENRIPRVVNIIEVSPKVAMLRNRLVVRILPWKKCKRKKFFLCLFESFTNQFGKLANCSCKPSVSLSCWDTSQTLGNQRPCSRVQSSSHQAWYSQHLGTKNSILLTLYIVEMYPIPQKCWHHPPSAPISPDSPRTSDYRNPVRINASLATNEEEKWWKSRSTS